MEREDQNITHNSPLLQVFEDHGLAFNREEGEDGRNSSEREKSIEEIKKQLWLAVPLIIVSLLLYSLQAISIMFVGHLGEQALSSSSLASSFASASGFNLLNGMASALDTFCGQSYGAKQYRMLGVHTQRAMFVLSIVSIPIAVLWANTGYILAAVGQDLQISSGAGLYARFMIPSLFAYGLLQCQIRFLRTQNNIFPMMLCSGITTILHVFVCWILVYKSGLGYRGAALANSISDWINVLLLSFYIKFSSPCKETWPGLTMEALHNIISFLKLAIPSAIMFCFKSWSFQLVIFLSGLLPNPALETSVLSISYSTAVIAWMIPTGLSGAVSVRVSNELGAGHPQAAHLAVRISIILATVQGMVVGLAMILTRNVWGYAFSYDLEVVKYLAVMVPIIATSSFVDGVQAVLSGIARGCGWQKIGAYINLGSFYLVGIPSGVVLAFVLHIGGKGLWVGITLALTVQLILFLIITVRTNWELQAKKAIERVNNSSAN